MTVNDLRSILATGLAWPAPISLRCNLAGCCRLTWSRLRSCMFPEPEPVPPAAEL
jgi:hypothetical protein